MKDFTIGQVRNDVIEHGDNYYGSRIGQAGYNQSPAEGRWIFRFFPRHFCIDHRHNCFPIGRHSPFIAFSVRINCSSYFHRGVPFESPSHENLSIQKTATFPCAEIKIRLARLGASPTTINYRAPGIIRRKPPRVLIKPVIQPLDFLRLKTARRSRIGTARGPNLFDIALELVWILDEGFNLATLSRAFLFLTRVLR